MNTRSVCRPKDGDWRAGSAILDVGEGASSAEQVRVEYDLERAVEAIRRSERPDDFGEFLRRGGG